MATHKSIKRFGLEGTIADDSMFIRFREQQEFHLLAAMREAGYVPVLGFGPFFSTSYDEEKDTYTFVLSIYGIHVGVKKASTIEGIDGAGRWYERNHGRIHGEADRGASEEDRD
jgi:hypothetical protein